MRGALSIALGVCLIACEGGEIAIFSANQAGSAGLADQAGAPPAGAAGALAGAFSAGSGGSNDPGEAGDAGSSPAGSGGAAIGLSCQNSQDCDSNYYCAKRGCTDSQGNCVPLPQSFTTDASLSPVCGCDRITYWNDSLRQYLGVSASTSGVCPQSAQSGCSRKEECGSPPKATVTVSCSHLLPMGVGCGVTPPPGSGLCWITPLDCSTSDPPQTLVCANNSSDPPTCSTRCQANQSGLPFMPLHGQSCP